MSQLAVSVDETKKEMDVALGDLNPAQSHRRFVPAIIHHSGVQCKKGHRMANPRSENHTQPPVKALDSKLNSEHAAYVLRGILQGIVADSELGHQEISILNAWLQSQRDFENDDARELLNLIGDVLADGTVTTDELQHIYILIDDIIEYGDRPEDEFDGLMHELLGLSQGMVSDGRITEGEFLSLTKWMIDNEHIVRAGPAYEIVARINEICEEGVVDQSELDKLLEVLKELSRQCQ